MPVGTTIAPVAARCRRCGRERWLIVDDGPSICRICLMAWVWLARTITAGEAIVEPDIVAMRHFEHEVPTPGCPLCTRSGAPGLLHKLDQRSRPF